MCDGHGDDVHNIKKYVVYEPPTPFPFDFTQTANYGSALNPLRLTYVTERQIKAGRHEIAFPCNLFHDSIPGET